MMRILWAFDVVPAPGTKEPLEFADYAGALPGNPAEDMPVKLRCRSEARKAVVVKTYERETAVRPEMVSFTVKGDLRGGDTECFWRRFLSTWERGRFRSRRLICRHCG